MTQKSQNINNDRLWRQIQKRRDSYLPRHRRNILNAMKAQISPVLEQIRDGRDPEAVLREMDYLIKDEPMREAFFSLYSEVMPAFGEGTQEALKSQGIQFRTKKLGTHETADRTESLWIYHVRQWLEGAEATSRIVSVNDTTRYKATGLLRDILDDSVEEGLGIYQIQKRILQEMPRAYVKEAKFRADRIARTELVSASNRGSLMGAQMAGVLLKKKWLSSGGDGRTREEHLKAEAQYMDDPIPLDGLFIVGGEELSYPGDFRGSAHNVINCRCTLVYERAEQNQVREIPPLPVKPPKPKPKPKPKPPKPAPPKAPELKVNEATGERVKTSAWKNSETFKKEYPGLDIEIFKSYQKQGGLDHNFLKRLQEESERYLGNTQVKLVRRLPDYYPAKYKKGAFYKPEEGWVYIPGDGTQRWKASPFHRRKVFYHEFGHWMDDNIGITRISKKPVGRPVTREVGGELVELSSGKVGLQDPELYGKMTQKFRELRDHVYSNQEKYIQLTEKADEVSSWMWRMTPSWYRNTEEALYYMPRYLGKKQGKTWEAILKEVMEEAPGNKIKQRNILIKKMEAEAIKEWPELKPLFESGMNANDIIEAQGAVNDVLGSVVRREVKGLGGGHDWDYYHGKGPEGADFLEVFAHVSEHWHMKNPIYRALGYDEIEKFILEMGEMTFKYKRATP